MALGIRDAIIELEDTNNEKYKSFFLELITIKARLRKITIIAYTLPVLLISALIIGITVWSYLLLIVPPMLIAAAVYIRDEFSAVAFFSA